MDRSERKVKLGIQSYAFHDAIIIELSLIIIARYSHLHVRNPHPLILNPQQVTQNAILPTTHHQQHTMLTNNTRTWFIPFGVGLVFSFIQKQKKMCISIISLID